MSGFFVGSFFFLVPISDFPLALAVFFQARLSILWIVFVNPPLTEFYFRQLLAELKRDLLSQFPSSSFFSGFC